MQSGMVTWTALTTLINTNGPGRDQHCRILIRPVFRCDMISAVANTSHPRDDSHGLNTSSQ
jgi:hypothetical protein